MGWLLVIHSIVAASLVVVVLLQRSEKSALGSLGGGDSSSGIFAARSTANLLTRITAILATIFIILALLLSYLSTRQQTPQSLFDNIPSSSIGSTLEGSAPSSENAPNSTDTINTAPSPLPDLPTTSDSSQNETDNNN